MNAHTKAFSELLSGLAAVQPKFTRKLTRDEIMALSHDDHIEYIHWLQANMERLNTERRATGARHQNEFMSLDRDYDKPTSLRNWEYGE